MARASLKLDKDYESEEEEEKGDEEDKDDGNQDTEVDDDKHDKDGEEEKVKQRKDYTCRICNQPMRNTGHRHFRGIRYCPNAPGQIPLEEWLIHHHHIELKIFKSGQ